MNRPDARSRMGAAKTTVRALVCGERITSGLKYTSPRAAALNHSSALSFRPTSEASDDPATPPEASVTENSV